MKNIFVFLDFYLQLLAEAVRSYIDPFSTNVPLMDEPGSWFLLANCLKYTCGRVTF